MDKRPKNKDIENAPDLKKLRRELQIGKDGLSWDFHNEYGTAIGHCESILNNEISKLGWTEEETRKNILKKMISLPTYTEYMDYQKKILDADLNVFLTPTGREIVTQLNETVAKIKRLIVKEPKDLDVAGVLALLEECEILIDRRKRDS